MPSGKRVIRLSVNTIGSKEVQAALRVLKSGYVTQGKQVAKFEGVMLDYLKASPSVGALMVNSGSSANLLAAALLRKVVDGANVVGERNEVVMPALTWATTVAPFIQYGFKPIFVDVTDGYVVDPERVAEALGPRTAAIVAPHLLGNAAPIKRLLAVARRNDLMLIEDCCEALGTEVDGRRVGTFGDAATFSTYFAHHLTTIEGGLLVYPRKFHEVRAWREHGWIRSYPEQEKNDVARRNVGLDPRWLFSELGYNLRNDDVHAAIGIEQFYRLERWRERRIANAAWFDANLHHPMLQPGLPEQLGVTPNPFNYPILVQDNAAFKRAEIVVALEESGVETRPVMTGDITQHPWYGRNASTYAVARGGLDRTRRIHRNGFLIPCHPMLEHADLVHVRSVIDAFMREKTGEGLE